MSTAAKPHSRVRGFSKEENKRRYELHKNVRKTGCIVSTSDRIIFMPMDEKIENQYITELARNFGYQIQTEAFVTQKDTEDLIRKLMTENKHSPSIRSIMTVTIWRDQFRYLFTTDR